MPPCAAGYKRRNRVANHKIGRRSYMLQYLQSTQKNDAKKNDTNVLPKYDAVHFFMCFSSTSWHPIPKATKLPEHF